MRTIHLDLETDGSGGFADDSYDDPIRCAMGEVLFQAGVPLETLEALGCSENLVHDWPVLDRLRQYVGWAGTDLELIRACQRIERIYDIAAATAIKRKREQADRLLIRAGRRIGVVFILDGKLQLEHQPHGNLAGVLADA